MCGCQAGVLKLKEAREVVDSLKKKAAQQSQVLAEKQREADESMAAITSTIQVSTTVYMFRYSLKIQMLKIFVDYFLNWTSFNLSPVHLR